MLLVIVFPSMCLCLLVFGSPTAADVTSCWWQHDRAFGVGRWPLDGGQRSVLRGMRDDREPSFYPVRCLRARLLVCWGAGQMKTRCPLGRTH